MSFPESKRVLYSKNPLEEVICQLRFPPILEISSRPPAAFQNKIRSQYPLYEKEEPSLPKGMAELLSDLPIPKLSESVTHKFLTADSDRFISLTPNFLALTDHKYTRWERFRSAFSTAQASLEEIYQPAFYTRIGLRYRDIIHKEKIGLDNEPWSNLLNTPLIGLLGDPAVSDEVQTIQTVATIKLKEISGGVTTLRHGLGISPETNKQFYFIDVDLFTMERSACDAVSSVLDQFNKIVGNLFRWAIHPKLHDALGPTELAPEDSSGPTP